MLFLVIVISLQITGLAQAYTPTPETTPNGVYGRNDNMYSTGVSSYSLTHPAKILADASGVFIVDTGNNRVMHYPPNSTNPDRIYGQSSYTSNDAPYHPSAVSLYHPGGIAVDAGGVYIADTGNNRVLHYPGSYTAPDRLYGQARYDANLVQKDVVGLTGLNQPVGLATGGKGIYVADSGHNRVVYFPGTSVYASRIYGQPVAGSPSPDDLSNPFDVAVNSTGVFIADTGHNRVLHYPGVSTGYDRVYGQPNINTVTPNSTGINASSLSGPEGLAVFDIELYISDTYNNRVLHYLDNSTTADGIFGQFNFNTNQANFSGVNAVALNRPMGLSVTIDKLYIADTQNNRALQYNTPSPLANQVYGQSGNFFSANNYGGLSASNTGAPGGVAADANGVYLSDSNNNRVLHFSRNSTVADRIYGQSSFGSGTLFAPGANTLNDPKGIALDSTGVYIADTWNNRVLHYSGTSTTADRVYGQPNFTSDTASNSATLTTGLFRPEAVAADGNGLYIADTGNNRVLHYSGTATTPDRVYGQPNLSSNSSNNGGISANSLFQPQGIAALSGVLYIADSANNRVLMYTGTSNTAGKVYGQAGFNTNSSLVAFPLNNPNAVAIFGGGIYITSSYDSRVVHFTGTSDTPDRVYGQPYGSTETLEFPIAEPVGVSASVNGVYIADWDNLRVFRYPPVFDRGV